MCCYQILLTDGDFLNVQRVLWLCQILESNLKLTFVGNFSLASNFFLSNETHIGHWCLLFWFDNPLRFDILSSAILYLKLLCFNMATPRMLLSQILLGAYYVLVSYCSGKVLRRFVPVDKILKPVLLECLTPVTCYWSLSLIVQGEDELLLVFKVILQFI